MLLVDDLHTRYFRAGTPAMAVRGVSLAIPAGSATALVGESGSGKSTVALSILGAIRRPSGEIASGSIRVGDVELTGLSPDRLRTVLRHEIGFVPQDPSTALDPLYPVGSQIAEVLPRSMSRADRRTRVVELLESLGIEGAAERVDDYPHQFSGGMRQRVAIAVALAKEPSVLIADEPTTALDVTTQLGILALLDRLRTDQRLATLLITHDIRVARLVCQSVAVIYGGVVVEAGPINEVLDNPRHPYTRALVESSLVDVEPQTMLRAIPGQPPPVERMPPGCPFAPRCARVTSACDEMPTLDLVEGDRSLRCWNPVIV